MNEHFDHSIYGYYDNGGGVYLEGNIPSLLWLSNRIKSLSTVPMEVALASTPSPSIPPYTGTLTKILISPVSSTNEGMVAAHRDGDVLVVDGSRNALGRLADEIESLGEQAKGDLAGAVPTHVHIEYFEDDPFQILERDSLHFVISALS